MSKSNSSISNSCLLNDVEIKERINQNILISENYDPKQLIGCCYEFRVSEISYTYDYEKKTTQQKRGDTHIINPFETLTIITMEKVYLDLSHFLLLFSKGSLFAMGLTPISTAADPGFRGHLGITMTNLSARPIQFSKGVGFVKGSFFRLNQNVEQHYVGQHGDATMSWPYPSQFHTDPIDFDLLNASCWRFLPPPIRQTISKLNKVEKSIKLLIGIFLILVITNLIVLPMKGYLPINWYSHIEKTLNLIGIFASILGLIISMGFLRKTNE